ncbi:MULTISPECIES: hypothetical protein [unclassified Nocardiopsis]|uniref:hypothetical protein n=1 Tax=unclassified Nocardiopsis TaxID=2649073 RepID=UPI0013587FD7|nr:MULTISPECIES: hypothetical protein [unclassified Nocardiopsis]
MGALVRVAGIGAGAALLSAAAIGGGLWLAGQDPDVPETGDVHTAAPGCERIPAELVTSLLPGAVPETADHGPLSGGDSSVCSWSSADADQGARGVLRVDLSARFTDSTGEEPVSGARRTQEAYAALVPVRGEVLELPSGEGRVWRGQADGTAELAFTSDNLLVRVSYAGTSGAEPVGFETARDVTVEFAEQFGGTL